MCFFISYIEKDQEKPFYYIFAQWTITIKKIFFTVLFFQPPFDIKKNGFQGTITVKKEIT